jgi:hypothetical protein
MIKYEKELYAKYGRKYIATGKTGLDWDELELENVRLKNGIKAVLTENAHLADGKECTLYNLKKLVPEWEEEFFKKREN